MIMWARSPAASSPFPYGDGSEEETGAGLFCVFRDGPEWTPVVIDSAGKHRPDLAARLVDGLAEATPLDPADLEIDEHWADAIRELGECAERTFDDNPPDLELALFYRFVQP